MCRRNWQWVPARLRRNFESHGSNDAIFDVVRHSETHIEQVRPELMEIDSSALPPSTQHYQHG